MLNSIATLRAADPSDIRELARLFNFAGGGLPLHHWQRLAKSCRHDAWQIAEGLMENRHNGDHWKNWTVADHEDETAAGLSTYVMEPLGEDAGYSLPDIFVPVRELEDMVIGTQYISVLAAFPRFRNMGLGSRLLEHAERLAAGRSLSLIVADNNFSAMRLYERHGYRRHASRSMVKEGWQTTGSEWILMLK